MKSSPTMANLTNALLAVQKELKAVTKDATNPHFKNQYATLDALTEYARPLLTKHGIAVVQGCVAPDRDEDGAVVAMTVETTLLHGPTGEWLSTGVIIPLDKSNPQGAGSAVTYGRRYGLSALLALTTDNDDDGAAASTGAAIRATVRAMPSAKTLTGKKAVTVMPFGRNKGKKIADLPEAELHNTIEWATSTDATKFADLIATLEQEVERRHTVGSMEDPLPPAPEDDLAF